MFDFNVLMRALPLPLITLNLHHLHLKCTLNMMDECEKKL